MHVTNYSINKHQPGFVANTDADCDGVGSKRSLRALQEHLESQCGVQWQNIWSQASTNQFSCSQSTPTRKSSDVHTVTRYNRIRQ